MGTAGAACSGDGHFGSGKRDLMEYGMTAAEDVI